MTCFWDGILNLLTIRDINAVFDLRLRHKPAIPEFIRYLKEYNLATISITHMGSTLSEKQLTENQDHIRNLNPRRINNGYDCSGCDPVLFLIAELFDCNITHIYDGARIRYRNRHATKKLRFGSNTHHFWAIKRIDYI